MWSIFKNKEPVEDKPQKYIYILLKCKLCGTTFCDRQKDIPRLGYYLNLRISPKFHECEVAKQLKTEDSQIIKPVITALAISEDFPIKADIIKYNTNEDEE